MKIDFHVHILPPKLIKNREKFMDREDHFRLLHTGPKVKFATAEDVIADMDRNNINRSVVFGFPFKDTGLCREANNYIIEVVNKYPKRLIGYIQGSPTDPEFPKEIERCHEAGLHGVGELIPDAQKYDISDQKQMKAFTNICRERNLPVLMHSNEQVGHYYPGKGATGPMRAYKFAINNPDLKIIFAHWGGGLFFFELMPELQKDLKHVYYDTAASPFLFRPQVYEAARTAGVLKKVVLGSDFPLLSTARYFKELDKTDLNVEEKELICGKTAAIILTDN